MRIENIHFKNIGVFDDELIEFEPTGEENQAEIHIITGPNGSGKSTILYGLASAFDPLSKGFELYSSNFFYKRFRYFTSEKKERNEVPQEKISELYVDFANREWVRVYGSKNSENIAHQIYPSKYDFDSPNVLSTYQKLNESKIKNYHKTIWHKQKPIEEFDFAAFAYSGYRYVQGSKINGVKEFNDNPLHQSLEFVKKWEQDSDDYNINQWIANNISKRSISKEKGDKNAHKKYAQTVSNLENILSQILEQSIEFDIGLDPLNLFIKTNNTLLDFDVLPDGMRSLISWIADLMMRLDELKWVDDTPIFERRLFLFLDEIEVHLHPKWQRNVLPIVQKLFKNAQIFVTTHSPFVVNSVDNAWIHPIRLEGGKATMEKPFKSESGFSYPYILREVFGIEERFGKDAQTKLEDFYEIRDEILRTANQKNYVNKLKKLDKVGNYLRKQSTELNTIVEGEIRQLNTIIENEILNEKVG